MAVVAGVDFGTLSVRVSIVDSELGILGSAVAEYELHRKREDPEYATQSHDDQMEALVGATRQAMQKARVRGQEIASIALDTTGSSVIPVGKDLRPLGEYYLWCDHRAKKEAAEITALAHSEELEAIEWCGACIRRNGDLPNSFTGCAIIRRNAGSLFLHLNTAITLPRCCAGLRTRTR